jgi:UDP-GlcNAc:undecaprenyl-phosphate GlcNAc-1-phosphate transferase
MVLFSSFLIAMFISMILIPPLMRAAGRLGFVDIPDARKVHSHIVPRIGGIAMVCGTLLSMLLWMPIDRQVLAFVVGIVIIAGFGIWDDRHNLDYRVKFLGQLLAVLLVVLYGGVIITHMPLWSGEALPPYMAIPLTVFVLLGITNAINLSDGLDGLAGGTSLLSIGMIALLGYRADDAVVVLAAITLMGSLLGFLRYNTYPATVFMGDGGSQFLGFAAGVLAILLTQDEHPMLSSALPLLLLGLPILDTLYVMCQRIARGQSPFHADKNHIHHKLLSLGLDHYEAVFLIYLVQAGLVMSAYFLCYQSDLLILAIYAAFSLGIIGLFWYAAQTNWQLRRDRPGGLGSMLGARWQSMRDSGRFQRLAAGTALALLPLYFLFAVVAVPNVTSDIALLAAALFLVLLVLMFRRRGRAYTWMERGGAYILCAVTVYLFQQQLPDSEAYRLLLNVYFVTLAVAVVVGIFLAADARFRLTPLDFLVVFIAFTVPNLPNSTLGIWQAGDLAAKLIVLYYSLELILTRMGAYADMVRVVMVATACLFGLKGLI